MNEQKTTITVAEVASELGVCLPAAYALVHQGGFPVVHVGRRLVVPREAFVRWLNEQAGQQAEVG